MNVHCVHVCAVATPPNERVDKELVSSQIRSRMGHVLENADQTVRVTRYIATCTYSTNYAIQNM